MDWSQLLQPGGAEVVEGRRVVRGASVGRQDGVPAQSRGLMFENLHLQGCCFVGQRWMSMTFQNCVFEECQWSDILAWNSHLHACAFIASRISQLSLACDDTSEASPSTIRDCTFRDCKLRDVDLSSVRTSSVAIDNCAMTKWFLRSAIITNVTAGGLVHGLNVIDCDLSGLQMADLRIREATFCDTRTIGCVWPNDDAHIAIPHGYASVLTSLMQSLDPAQESGCIAYLSQIRSTLGRQTSGVLSLHDIRSLVGETAAASLADRASRIVERFGDQSSGDADRTAGSPSGERDTQRPWWGWFRRRGRT